MTKDELDTITGLLTLASDIRNQSLALASKCQRCCIVDPGFPILWFGDIDTYLKTPKDKRAITVGVNPSGNELNFNKFGKYIHFPPLTTKHTDIDIEHYILALNNYFNNKPLAWFDRGMENKPYKYKEGNLIHIDCCSTIPTRPSWTGLCDPVKSLLKKQNEPIFEALLKLLKPSKVYIASNQSELPYIEGRCKSLLKLGSSPIPRITKQ